MSAQAEKSIEYYLKSTQLSPKEEYLYKGLGFAYDDSGRYEEAIAAFQKAIEINPKYESGYNSIGYLFENLGRYEEAITAYHKAIEINPKLLETYCRLSGLYCDIGELGKAEEECLKALQIDANYWWVYNCLGLVESAKGNFLESIEHYQTCIDKKPPTLGPPFNNIGEAFSLLGEYEKAIYFLKKAIENNSENAATGLGSMFVKSGKLQDAESLLLRAIEKQKYKSTPRLYLALTYLYLGETDKSNNYFNTVISFSDSIPNADNQFNKVTALLGLQKTEEAESILRQLAIRTKITQYNIKSFMYDLALLESAPNNSERVKEFIKKADEIFDMRERKRLANGKSK